MASENHCGVTAKSGHCKGMEEALEAHIKGKLRGMFDITFCTQKRTTHFTMLQKLSKCEVKAA